MTVEEFYDEIDGDFVSVKKRITSEERLRKYFRIFADSADFPNMLDALEKKDYHAAFQCVHSLKGTCMNLGFKRLAVASGELCEVLRPGTVNCDITDMLDEIKNQYNITVQAINKILSEGVAK